MRLNIGYNCDISTRYQIWRKEKMKKLVALMLSLMLLLSCICSAEAYNFDIDLNYLGQQVAAGTIQCGDDNDGCKVFDANIS